MATPADGMGSCAGVGVGNTDEVIDLICMRNWLSNGTGSTGAADERCAPAI